MAKVTIDAMVGTPDAVLWYYYPAQEDFQPVIYGEAVTLTDTTQLKFESALYKLASGSWVDDGSYQWTQKGSDLEFFSAPLAKASVVYKPETE